MPIHPGLTIHALNRTQITGVILLGTSLDGESDRLISQGSWDGRAIGDSMLARWATHANDGDDFVPPKEWCAKIAASGYGDKVSSDLVDFWTKEIRQCYTGEAGRQQLIMMAINLKERDGLSSRLRYIKAPVLYMQVCYSCQIKAISIDKVICAGLSRPGLLCEHSRARTGAFYWKQSHSSRSCADGPPLSQCLKSGRRQCRDD